MENFRVPLKSIVFGYNTLRSLVELLRSPKKLCVWSQNVFVHFEKFFALPWEPLCLVKKKDKLKKAIEKFAYSYNIFWAFPRSLAFSHKNVVPPWETLHSLTIILLFSDKFLVWSQNVCAALRTFESQNFGAWVRNCVFGNKTFAFTWKLLRYPKKLCVVATLLHSNWKNIAFPWETLCLVTVV